MTVSHVVARWRSLTKFDKKIIEKHKEGIMVLSGSLYGEVPSKILNIGEKQAEESLIWWKKTFGEDFYIEVSRHHQEDEKRVNSVLISMAKKHQIKLEGKISELERNKKTQIEVTVAAKLQQQKSELFAEFGLEKTEQSNEIKRLKKLIEDLESKSSQGSQQAC